MSTLTLKQLSFCCIEHRRVCGSCTQSFPGLPFLHSSPYSLFPVVPRFSGLSELLSSYLQSNLLTPKWVERVAMSRYIPPALRSKQAAVENETPIDRKPEDGYFLEEICYQFDHKYKPGTLNGRDQLAFILLFSHQHPQWPSKIFCKSNLRLLTSIANILESGPAFQPSSEPIHEFKQTAKLIPVFTQDRTLRSHGRKNGEAGFIFSGMYTVSSVEYLEPRSQQLVNMLEVKFAGGKQRSPEDWKKSLTMRWAVVDLQKVESTLRPMEPLKPIKKKGVTEMLEEMRLREVTKTQGGDLSNPEGAAMPEASGSQQQSDVEKQA